MMVEESILTLGLFCWLFLRTAREGEERQELLDYASANGPRAERGTRGARRLRRARQPSCASVWSRALLSASACRKPTTSRPTCSSRPARASAPNR